MCTLQKRYIKVWTVLLIRMATCTFEVIIRSPELCPPNDCNQVFFSSDVLIELLWFLTHISDYSHTNVIKYIFIQKPFK